MTGSFAHSLTPLSGRGEELRYLSERLDSARRGEGGLVMLSGEPGVGKSRLMMELALLAGEQGCIAISGGAYEMDEMVPYLPFIEAIRSYARRASLEQMATLLTGPSLPISLIVPELRAADRDSPFPIQDDHYSLIEALCSFLTAIATASPGGLLICLDDLQWADDSSLVVLEHLVRRLPSIRMLIVAAYRDTDLDLTKPLARTVDNVGRRAVTSRMPLRRISRAGVVQMLATLGPPNPPASVVDAVFTETEGNPFFVEEVFHYLNERGRLFGPSGGWRRDISFGETEVPQSVRLVIGRRLQRVSARARQVLSVAAVVGPSCELRVLEALVGAPESDVLDSLEEAEAIHIIRLDASGRITFSHDLVRQVLLGEVSIIRRQRLHARVAKVLQEIHAANLDDHLIEVASHYRSAGAAVDARQAVEVLTRAAGKAAAVWAHAEAIGFYRAALELLEGGPTDPLQRAVILVKLADQMYANRSDFSEAASLLEEALAIYAVQGDSEAAADAHSKLGRSLSTVSIFMDISRAREHYRLAAELLADTDRNQAKAELHLARAEAAAYAADPEEELEAAQEALRLAQSIGDIRLASIAGARTASGLSGVGRLSASLKMFETARQFALQVGGDAGWWVARYRGLLHELLLDPAEAVRLYRTARNELRLSPGQQGQINMQMVRALATSGRVAEARRLAEEPGRWGPMEAFALVFESDWDLPLRIWGNVARLSSGTGDRWNEWSWNYWRGWLLRLRGDLEASLAALERGRDIVEQGYQPCLRLWIYPWMAIVRAEIGDTGLAAELVRACDDILAGGEDWRGLAGRVALARGVVAVAKKEPAGALVSLRHAMETFRAYECPFDEAEAHIAAARAFALSRRNKGQAHTALDEAALIYRRAAAEGPWLARVEAERRLLPPDASHAGAAPLPDGLTPREAEVLRLLALGKTNQEIADQLVISLNTVLRHVSNILSKTGSSNRTEAGAYAHRHSLS